MYDKSLYISERSCLNFVYVKDGYNDKRSSEKNQMRI